jgi:hypothetical protein
MWDGTTTDELTSGHKRPGRVESDPVVVELFLQAGIPNGMLIDPIILINELVVKLGVRE